MQAMGQARARATQLLEAGAPAAAEPLLRELLKQAPKDLELLRLLAIAVLQLGRPGEARVLLESGLERASGNALMQMNLGSVLRALGDTDGAISAFRRACALGPQRAAAWFNLAKALKSQGLTGEALEPAQRAVDLQPGHAAAQSLLGDLLKATGDVVGSEQAFRRAIAVRPTSGSAWWGLANLKVVDFEPGDIDQMQAQLRDPRLSAEAHTQIEFALARALEQQGQFAGAFEILQRANVRQRKRLPWDRDAFARQCHEVRRRFPAPFAACDQQVGDGVIFVVGLPRSGSTVVEQILAAHPEVSGASELPDLPAVLAAESARRGVQFPAWVADARPEDWTRLGAEYLERTRRWLGGRARFTDKLPNNFLYVGAALSMLPAARVIGCIRDPLDTCLSCYQQWFAKGQEFSYDLEDLAAYYADFRFLSAHWVAHYPQHYMEFGYEQLVAEPRREIERLLEFCSLTVDPACFTPHLAGRPVRTASAAQVRQPLDGRGIGRSAAYRHFLDPLRAALIARGI